LDILQRKAIIYGIKNNIRNGLQAANQIKLIAPSEYLGYKLAFKLLVQAKRLDTAKAELQKAAKYAAPTMDFYFDQMSYINAAEIYLQLENARVLQASEGIQMNRFVAPDIYFYIQVMVVHPVFFLVKLQERKQQVIHSKEW